MLDRPELTEHQEQVLNALAAQAIAPGIDPSAPPGLDDAALVRHLRVTETEIRHDTRVLEEFGIIEFEETQPRDPIRDADTDPTSWLFASGSGAPIAAQCYCLAFWILLEPLTATGETVGYLGTLLSDNKWPAFVGDHAHLLKCEQRAAVEFLADEVVEQLLRRISDRYPVAHGYSPVHIALVIVYRAMREAHDEAAAHLAHQPV